jgi:hypothetical protein
MEDASMNVPAPSGSYLYVLYIVPEKIRGEKIIIQRTQKIRIRRVKELQALEFLNS